MRGHSLVNIRYFLPNVAQAQQTLSISAHKWLSITLSWCGQAYAIPSQGALTTKAVPEITLPTEQLLIAPSAERQDSATDKSAAQPGHPRGTARGDSSAGFCLYTVRGSQDVLSCLRPQDPGASQ